jgi:hypothetical protein
MCGAQSRGVTQEPLCGLWFNRGDFTIKVASGRWSEEAGSVLHEATAHPACSGARLTGSQWAGRLVAHATETSTARGYTGSSRPR